jgi:hypothetical protein
MDKQRIARELVQAAKELVAWTDYVKGTLTLRGKVEGEIEYAVTNADHVHLGTGNNRLIYRGEEYYVSIHLYYNGRNGWDLSSTGSDKPYVTRNMEDAPPSYRAKIVYAIMEAWNKEAESLGDEMRQDADKADAERELERVQGKIAEVSAELKELKKKESFAKKIALMDCVAKNILLVAQDTLRTGGMLQAPPALLAEILEWATSQVAAKEVVSCLNSVRNFEERVKETQEWLAQRQDQLDREDYSKLSRDSLERRIEDFKRDIESYQAMADDWRVKAEDKKKEVTYPRVRIRMWKRAAKDFPVEKHLKGWRYLKRIEQAKRDDKYDEDRAKEYSTIRVTLVRGNIKSSGSAYWKNSGSMIIKIGRGWKDSVEHELRHFAQTYMNAVIIGLSSYGTSSFGRPSWDIRTPEISQHDKTLREVSRKWEFPGWKEKVKKTPPSPSKNEFTSLPEVQRRREQYLKDLAQDLKKKGITPDDSHALDDV